MSFTLRTLLLTLLIALVTPILSRAQAEVELTAADTAMVSAETLLTPTATAVSTRRQAKKVRAQGGIPVFKPDPQRALWLSLVCPGAGQIYNRKYWKLPIFYGGFLGCVYAFTWNQQQYKDYAQAYLDIMDDDPNTASYTKMFPEGFSIAGQESQYQQIFKRRKDYYRRYRDLSAFCFIGVYLLSVVDAYVDASLSEFDISPDLSLRLSPAVLNGSTNFDLSRHQAYGIGCALTF